MAQGHQHDRSPERKEGDDASLVARLQPVLFTDPQIHMKNTRFGAKSGAGMKRRMASLRVEGGTYKATASHPCLVA
jgi:hypothetical protein